MPSAEVLSGIIVGATGLATAIYQGIRSRGQNRNEGMTAITGAYSQTFTDLLEDNRRRAESEAVERERRRALEEELARCLDGQATRDEVIRNLAEGLGGSDGEPSDDGSTSDREGPRDDPRQR